jgi:hypothetical protein
MQQLEHAEDPCTGHWRLVETGVGRALRCDQCGARFPATSEFRLAAIDENYAGIYLSRLAREGAPLLGS